MPGDPAWRRPPQSRSPPWRSRPPGGSLQPQRPPRRLPPPELRSFAARRGSGWGGRDPVSVIRRTCSHSELSVASFVRDNAEQRPGTPGGGRRPPGTRAWGAGGRSSPPRPVCQPEARPWLLGSAAAGLLLLPASWLQFPHVPTEPKLRGPSKPPPPVCGGGGGGPRPPRQPGPASAPRPPTQRDGYGGKVCCAVNYGGEFLFLFTSTGNQKGCLTREKVM